MGILVRAIEKGYYGALREPGEEFEIADTKAFSKKWMERVGTEKSGAGKKDADGAGSDGGAGGNGEPA